MGPTVEEGDGTLSRRSTNRPISLAIPGPLILQSEQLEPEELDGFLRLFEPHVVLLSSGRSPSHESKCSGSKTEVIVCVLEISKGDRNKQETTHSRADAVENRRRMN